MHIPFPTIKNLQFFSFHFTKNSHKQTNISISMAEEQEFQSQKENHQHHHNLLCINNNCSFFGSPKTLNMCSKCYNHPLTVSPSSSTLPSTSHPCTMKPLSPEISPPATGRCSSCRKKVGLTGFRCKCGITFCGTHRYPEKHGCSFDFQAVGRLAIARDNPVVKGVKLHKI